MKSLVIKFLGFLKDTSKAVEYIGDKILSFFTSTVLVLMIGLLLCLLGGKVVFLLLKKVIFNNGTK